MYLETIKKLIEIDDSIIIVGSASFYLLGMDYQPNDIDIVVDDISRLQEVLDIDVYTTSSFYSKTGKRGVGHLNGIQIDIFIGDEVYDINIIDKDGVKIKHCSIDGYLEYCESVINNGPHHWSKLRLISKYSNLLNLKNIFN